MPTAPVRIAGAIHGCYQSLEKKGLPEAQIHAQIAFAQQRGFFHLAAAKEARLAKLKQFFTRVGVQRIFLSGNLGAFECAISGIQVSVLPKAFFEIVNDAGITDAIDVLKGAVVIVNNNDLGTPQAQEAFSKLYECCDCTCFVAWDWDNHHWLALSTFLAAYCDIYAPAHHENLYLLSRYNWLITGPIYCTSVQWPRRFLADHLPEILTVERKSVPLGMHIPYSQFEFRIQVISTLNQHYPSVGFSDRNFHTRTPEDRLHEWVAYKMHWIMPVLNDVPIRIFDALITGGIPIVPASMGLLEPLLSLPDDFIVYYSPGDIINPTNVVQKALQIFDQTGTDGVTKRHRYALEHFHGDVSVSRMLSTVKKALEITT